MKIQFATKQMTVPERVYSHAEHRINELDPFFRGTPEAAVVFGAEDGKAVVELTIFAGSTIFRVVEKTSDMMFPLSAASCGRTTPACPRKSTPMPLRRRPMK